MRLRTAFLIAFCVCLLSVPTVRGEGVLLSGAGDTASDWEVIVESGSPHALDLKRDKGPEGLEKPLVRLDLDFPGEAGIRRLKAMKEIKGVKPEEREPEFRSQAKPKRKTLYELMDWTGCDRLCFDVRLPQDAPLDVQAIAYVRDADLNWFQSLRMQPITPGRWTTVSFDISDTSDQWVFKGHFRPWDGYVKQEIQELGLKLISKRKYAGFAFVDNVRVVPLGTASVRGSPPALINFRTNETSPGRYEKFEITFDVMKTYKNPFDPREVDIECTFVAPSGAVTVVPAFYYQNYIRSVEARIERLIPLGRSQWKIRFAPAEVGTYRYFIDLEDGAHVRTAARSFEAVPSSNPGFVRISKADHNYFEFDNGQFFYPIGHNICASFDVRNAEQLGINLLFDEGTAAYDRYLSGMVRGHETLGRIWMACWAFAIEWSRAYNDYYRGLGRYSMQNGWRLDYILDFAERNGIYLMITFDSHGHWETSVESNWDTSPYNIVNGGILDRPVELFYNPEAQRLYEQRVRYIMARWGYSPAVFS